MVGIGAGTVCTTVCQMYPRSVTIGQLLQRPKTLRLDLDGDPHLHVPKGISFCFLAIPLRCLAVQLRSAVSTNVVVQQSTQYLCRV